MDKAQLLNLDPFIFKNPKVTTSAVVIQDEKLLLVQRTEQPFKGVWDFVGGYADENETPEQCMIREVKEELNVECSVLLIGSFAGTAQYQNSIFPVVNFAYLVEFTGTIKLSEEHSNFAWIPINDVGNIAFDSNKNILTFIKDNFYFDLARVRELIQQLDNTAQFNEQSLYKAIIDGYVSKVYKDNILIGLGWIYLRQTLLRKQAVIEDMIVDKFYRGQGFGTKILQDLLEWAKGKNVDVVELTSNPNRLEANEFYKKNGFQLHNTNHYLKFLDR